MGRAAVAIDVSPVAYCISHAKTNPPSAQAARSRISKLETSFDARLWEGKRKALPEFFQVAYHRRTLQQLLYVRESLAWARSDVDCMLAAIVLGALHGESERSPSFLSNQMPHTIATKPDYSVRFWEKHGFTAPERDVFDLLRDKVTFRYATGVPEGRATVFCGDMRTLPDRMLPEFGPVKCVVTSPPYLDITNFEEDQWLRNWFLGGPPSHLSSSHERQPAFQRGRLLGANRLHVARARPRAGAKITRRDSLWR